MDGLGRGGGRAAAAWGGQRLWLRVRFRGRSRRRAPPRDRTPGPSPLFVGKGRLLPSACACAHRRPAVVDTSRVGCAVWLARLWLAAATRRTSSWRLLRAQSARVNLTSWRATFKLAGPARYSIGAAAHGARPTCACRAEQKEPHEIPAAQCFAARPISSQPSPPHPPPPSLTASCPLPPPATPSPPPLR